MYDLFVRQTVDGNSKNYISEDYASFFTYFLAYLLCNNIMCLMFANRWMSNFLLLKCLPKYFILYSIYIARVATYKSVTFGF